MQGDRILRLCYNSPLYLTRLRVQAPQSSEQDAKMVTFHTNHGDIVIKTFVDKAPETVKNFLDYCREGFYDNTIFTALSTAS